MGGEYGFRLEFFKGGEIAEVCKKLIMLRVLLFFKDWQGKLNTIRRKKEV